MSITDLNSEFPFFLRSIRNLDGGSKFSRKTPSSTGSLLITACVSKWLKPNKRM